MICALVSTLFNVLCGFLDVHVPSFAAAIIGAADSGLIYSAGCFAGITIVSLGAGGTPFAQLGDDELRIYRRICRCVFHWPATPAGHDISADARDLVAQLLQRDPAKRIGMVRYQDAVAILDQALGQQSCIDAAVQDLL